MLGPFIWGVFGPLDRHAILVKRINTCVCVVLVSLLTIRKKVRTLTCKKHFKILSVSVVPILLLSTVGLYNNHISKAD